MKSHSDEDGSLLERIEQGDDLAIALLYDRYASVVYTIALRVLGNSTLAEQVLTDVFLEIWRTPARFLQIVGSLSTSLILIARNRALAVSLDQPIPDLDHSLPNWAAASQAQTLTRDQACEAVAELPRDRRAMLEHAFFAASAPLSAATLISSEAVSQLAGTGLEITDIASDIDFARRELHCHDAIVHIEGINRLARVFAGRPESILQELVGAAVDLCGADSAGISIQHPDGPDDDFYHWAATAGQYSGFLDSHLPRYPSACGVTLERNRPQHFRVDQRFFDIMGVDAPTVTDGLLLPWQADQTRGTIWIMAHGRTEAFDAEDCRMMQALADFAATGVSLHQQQSF